jgi:hypothetical protein
MRLVIALLALPVISVYYGWALSVIWNWYVPLLGGPTISIPIAVGIACIVSMLSSDKDSNPEKVKERLIAMAIKPPLLILLAGFFRLFL